MSNIKNICSKYNLDPNGKIALDIRNILGNNLGYFPMVCKWVVEKECNISEIKETIRELKLLNVKRSISTFDTYENLVDFIETTKRERKTNQIIKSIPSNSRGFVDDKIREVIYNISLEKEEKLKSFFSHKGGTCKSSGDIYQAIRNISKEDDLSYNQLYKKISKAIKYSYIDLYNPFRTILNISAIMMDYFISFFPAIREEKKREGIIYADGSIIIVKVSTFNLSKKIGSNSWCISNQESFFDSYTSGDRDQYFLYDTNYDSSSKESMIGFTVGRSLGERKVSHSHYKNDTVISEQNVYQLLLEKCHYDILKEIFDFNFDQSLIGYLDFSITDINLLRKSNDFKISTLYNLRQDIVRNNFNNLHDDEKEEIKEKIISNINEPGIPLKSRLLYMFDYISFEFTSKEENDILSSIRSNYCFKYPFLDQVKRDINVNNMTLNDKIKVLSTLEPESTIYGHSNNIFSFNVYPPYLNEYDESGKFSTSGKMGFYSPPHRSRKINIYVDISTNIDFIKSEIDSLNIDSIFKNFYNRVSFGINDDEDKVTLFSIYMNELVNIKESMSKLNEVKNVIDSYIQ